MDGIYLDHAATSFPKAPGVAAHMNNYLVNIGSNVNRGSYNSSFSAANTVYETRELICKLFNFDKPDNVVFTKNITESLNVLIKGLLKTGDHVLVSSMEHNAVMRPLNSTLKNGIEISRVPCDNLGCLSLETVEKMIKPNTKAVIMTHASNVCGTILPLEEIGNICKKKNICFIIDCAQTAGFLDLDFVKLNADALAFTGHKGLLGPQGIGGFIINDNLAKKLEPLIEGGTGSVSEQEIQPQYLPDKFEAGTPNLPGIYGLNAALKYILQKEVKNIRKTELSLTKLFIQSVKKVKGIKLIGSENITERTAIVSLDFPGHDNADISHQLAKDFNIMTRCGLHCAPSAHKTLGTFPQGTVRFSFSQFNNKKEVKLTVNAIKSCLL
ncbi:MAG: aminotransferase class V-fold PLP-dependent enzyme [Clostridia bacterium]|nr:aminotransferase class V-fold PLP-dependent enzyme [Clostridia bacterium]MDD4048275.1 aminotransferase class V-fold PLP-dependent enzyme [Clostridia bacterium]